MDPSRREWLVRSAQLTGAGVLVAGLGWGHHEWQRHAYREDLRNRAHEPLAEKADRERGELPARARDEFRDYMHGPCLRVPAFVDRITSTAFRERLAVAGSDEHGESLLSLEFEELVVRESDILRRVDDIARRIGQELDRRWGACCVQIADRWSECALPHVPATVPHRLTARVEPTIRQHLQKAQQRANHVRDLPSLTSTVESIGVDVLFLYPIVRNAVTGSAFWPVFLITSLIPIWRGCLRLLENPGPDLKRDISSALADLGNRAGSEFELVVGQLILQLQQWQEEAISGEIERCTDLKYASVW